MSLLLEKLKKVIKDTLTIKFDKAFGLDIGDRSVEIIELEKVFKFSIVTYGRAELPEGVVENGKILDQSILAESLKKVLKEAKPKRVSTNKVIVSLPDSQVFVKCFSVDTALKAGALTKEIVEKMSLQMPLNIDKTYWDYIEKPLPDKSKKLIMFFCVPKDIANSYVKFCNSIGLEVVSLCLESLSLARAILKSSSKQSLIIDMGARSTNLSFFDSNDKINMTVTIPVAGQHMTEAISIKLHTDIIEAENLKIKNGFKEDKDNNIMPAIEPVMKDILGEIKEAISYYEESFKQKLEDIYMVGGSALLPNITTYMQGALKREVMLASGLQSSNISNLKGKNSSFSLIANVFGLGTLGASGEFKDMNLLKKMPASEVNSVKKLNLFNMGYLSKVNTMRTILNNKYILVMVIILIGIIFAILLQQAEQYGYATSATSFGNNF